LRIVVTGATGNVGTSLLRSLSSDPQVESVLGVARRTATLSISKVTWAAADVADDDLTKLFEGADVVVHLAWLIQPSRRLDVLHRTNLLGSRRVFEAVEAARVGALVYASSVGTYAAGPKDHRVDESWPATGVPTSFYSVHKAAVEEMLDGFEESNPGVRVVRLRPALIFKREAASGIRRLFFGPLLPNPVMKARLLPLAPAVRDMVFQVVHTDDVSDAYRRAITTGVRGAFNIAAEPVIDPKALADNFGAPRIALPAGVVRSIALATWKLGLQPTPPGWLDMGLNVPLMDTRRAREELGWSAQTSSLEAISELLEGIRDATGIETPPLAPGTSGLARWKELRTGIGSR
jgi:UDP-glucose 4-epimerase